MFRYLSYVLLSLLIGLSSLGFAKNTHQSDKNSTHVHSKCKGNLFVKGTNTFKFKSPNNQTLKLSYHFLQKGSTIQSGTIGTFPVQKGSNQIAVTLKRKGDDALLRVKSFSKKHSAHTLHLSKIDCHTPRNNQSVGLYMKSIRHKPQPIVIHTFGRKTSPTLPTYMLSNQGMKKWAKAFDYALIVTAQYQRP